MNPAARGPLPRSLGLNAIEVGKTPAGDSAPDLAGILAAPGGFPFHIPGPLAVEVHKLWPGPASHAGRSRRPGASTPGNLGDPVYLNTRRDAGCSITKNPGNRFGYL